MLWAIVKFESEKFKDGWVNVHDEPRPCRPSLISEDCEWHIWSEDTIEVMWTTKLEMTDYSWFQRYKVNFHRFHGSFSIPLFWINWVTKNCSRWISNLLSKSHKTKRYFVTFCALSFLIRYHPEEAELLDYIVPGDETDDSSPGDSWLLVSQMT